jgi:hypothetical protein
MRALFRLLWIGFRIVVDFLSGANPFVLALLGGVLVLWLSGISRGTLP